MLQYPIIDPVAFHVGPVLVHWYGLSYLVSFLLAWGLATYRANQPSSGWRDQEVSDLIFYSALGVVLGGRLGYMLFYNVSTLVIDPLSLFKVWDGGMSFHGGMLGVGIATWLFARRYQRPWIQVIDFVAPLVPLGLACGRLGNFVNGELWGRVSQVPWAMVFPSGGPAARHPSQLYEFFFEGIVLFIILWTYSRRPRPPFAVTAMFLLWYGLFRFCLEFLREPDAPLGFVAFHWLTMGQLLSFPMILVGLVVLIRTNRNKEGDHG